ncbi:MAG: ABC transporter permease DevC [Planctomycetia bacterium]|nr:ABC transporter permease DevC [Planctomycetia bacterium]
MTGLPRRRRIPLAWRNLTENPRRLAAYLAGTSFAVVLMMIELGFRNALLDNMVAVILALDGELFLINRERYVVSEPVRFPFRRVETARGVDGVASLGPFYLETEGTEWRNAADGFPRKIRVIAYRPEDDLLTLPEVRALRPEWDRPHAALADRRSKAATFGPLGPGTTTELQGRSIRVVGRFTLGTDFRNNGTVVMSERNLLHYFPERRGASWGENLVDIGVVRLRPGADPESVRAALRARLPADVHVLTRAELMAKERRFWENVAPIGVVFDVGLVMGFLVGMAICYQVLFSEVADRLGQFATLKAMGYSERRLKGYVVREGVDLAVLGYAAGLGVSLILFRALRGLTGMDVGLYPGDLAVVLVLTVSMCVASGALAARRLTTVDPADLFG